MSLKGSVSVEGENIWDAIGTIDMLNLTSTPFCRVCLRAHPEVKLLRPESVDELVDTLQLKNLWKRHKPRRLVCVWCEAAARAAMRLVCALRTMDAVHAAAGADKGILSARAMKRLNARATRERTKPLRATEVQLVTASGMPSNAPRKPPPEPSLAEMIVIDDDDDPPPAPSTAGAKVHSGPGSETPQLQQALLQPCIVTPVLQYLPTSVCVTPMLSQCEVPVNGVPMTSLQNVIIVQNQGTNVLTPRSVTSTLLNVQGDTEEPVLQDALIKMNEYLHGRSPQKRTKTYIGQQVRNDNGQIPMCVLTNIVGGSERPPPVAGGDKKAKVSARAGPPSDARGGKESKVEEVKQPILIGDKVDWEDKIPMDVISFMDAIDPQADQYIVPEQVLRRCL